MSSYTLYKAVKSLCPDTFKARFGVLKETDENTYGIFFKGGMMGNKRLEDAVSLTRNANVVFNIQGSKSVNGVKDAYAFCDNVVRTLDRTFNHTFTDSETGETVTILMVDVLSSVNALGNNKLDIPTFSLNFIITYSGGN